MLFGSLVEWHAWLHSYLCFSLLKKLFLSNLDSFLTPDYLSSFSPSFYRNLDSFSTARWIDWDFFWFLESFSTVGGLIELSLVFLMEIKVPLRRISFKYQLGQLQEHKQRSSRMYSTDSSKSYGLKQIRGGPLSMIHVGNKKSSPWFKF